MTLFEQMKKDIKEDVEEYKSEGEDILWIDNETESSISVYDDVDGCSREYTITDPLRINSEWITDKIIVTDSVQEIGKINSNEIALWLDKYIDKNMYCTLKNIIFVNDTEKDYDFLANYNEDFHDMLETNDLPIDSIGLMWFSHQIVLINVGAIEQCTQEMVDDGELYENEKECTVNSGIITTLVHEIRHLAQSNPYLPEEILQQRDDDEIDAENYAIEVCDSIPLPWALDREEKEKEEEEYGIE